ncbi:MULTISPECIES: hypothetical protein [Kocuria]|uniref:hypothetical protein n=1 Tax=Kocuria TaxID=57493 RepID=UPI000661059A|nr:MULTISPECIES: hypothetical protein [Kocuria]MCT1366639.1 hypothetical protein [Rothia sp. p3-SID1597]RUQ22757.1 hypothetical protein D8M21_04950 [Kocuria sp. HSID16901]
MSVLMSIFLFLHILGAALVFGLWVANFKPPRVVPVQFYAALLQLVTGILMWGMLEMGDGVVNHAKLGVKLVIGLAIAVTAFIGQRKYKAGEAVPTGIAHSVGGLALINIAVATLWN